MANATSWDWPVFDTVNQKIIGRLNRFCVSRLLINTISLYFSNVSFIFSEEKNRYFRLASFTSNSYSRVSSLFFCSFLIRLAKSSSSKD